MAAKKYEVIIDVNSGSVKIAGGEMLSLNQQVRILQKELGKVDGKEFTLVSAKLNETKDRAATVNARSRELFGTLSLLPGPVGTFASKIDGAISLMKVFSGFSLKDIRAQFGGLFDDIKGIIKTIGDATGASKVYGSTVDSLSGFFQRFGVAQENATKGAKIFTTALAGIGFTLFISLATQAIQKLVEFFDTSARAKEMTEMAKFQAQESAYWYDQDTKELIRQNNLKIATLKANGATAAEIRQQEIDNQIVLTKRLYDQSNKFYALEQEAVKNNNADLITEYSTYFRKYEEAYRDSNSQIAVLRQNDIADTEKEKKQANDKELSQQQANAQKQLALQKQQNRAQLDAEIALERAKDTRDKNSVENLRKLILKRILLEKDEVKITKEIREAAELEANQAADEEIERDIKAYQDGLDRKREANQKFIDDELKALRESQKQKENYYEILKRLYGQDSARALEQFQVVLEGRQNLVSRELTLLRQYRNTEEGLSKEQLAVFDQLSLEYNTILSQRIEVVNKLGEKLMQADAEQTNAEKKRLNSIISNDKELIKNRLDAVHKYLDIIDEETFAKDVAALAAYETQKAFIEQNITDDKLQKDALIANDDAYQARLKKNDEEYIEDIKKYNEIHNQLLIARAEFNNQIVQTVASSMSNISSFLSDIAGKNKKTQKAAVIIDKAAAIAQIIASTAVQVAKNPPLAFLYKALAATQILATVGGAARAIREIDSTSTDVSTTSGAINVIARRAQGGIVSGPGTSTSDSIPTMLSNGEFVINANASRMFAPILSQLNALGNQPQFSMGSLLTQGIGNSFLGATIDQDMENRTTPPIKTYVSATDMSNQQQMDRLIKSRSLI